jgi:3-oxoacyl-[acyl-carrier protein] reductase
MTGIRGKKALVTGASTGIGRAIALLLAREGADVVVHYHRSEEEARTVAGMANAEGVQAYLARADLTKAAEATRLVQEALDRFGRVDILINNAGGAIRRAPVTEASDALWEESFQLNVMSMVRMTRSVLPYMMEQNRGVIVNISSVAAQTGGFQSVHYAAMKGAVNTLTKGVANEVATFGIRVNAVAPGLVDTPFHRKTPGQDFQKAARRIPLGRTGVPEDIAPLAVFLCSDEAAWITGEVFKVAGGQ